MLTTILTSLARFSIKNPKTIAAIILVLVVGGFAVHYKLLVGERDKLRAAEAAYETAIVPYFAREATLREDIERERQAAAQAVVDREAARAALEVFRAGRRDDPEAVEWAAEDLPAGELSRLCEALPEMEGCQ